jgi:hypothetical protein
MLNFLKCFKLRPTITGLFDRLGESIGYERIFSKQFLKGFKIKIRKGFRLKKKGLLNGYGHEFLVACLQFVSLILCSLGLSGIFQLKYFEVFRQLDKRIIHSFLSLVPVPRRFAFLHGMQILIDHVFFQRTVV